MAYADACVSFDFSGTIFVSQGNIKSVELALRLHAPSYKHFLIFEIPSVMLENNSIEIIQKISAHITTQ